ncbi:unnamed protein product [Rodentolepis nana]|uniref:Hypotheticial protein n=1 Tax=Rodentolepis nana TaxID=102285 RepID=A0A0R3TTF0_RODNA|nr:unnamed protein product [Rodentolepis nana]
MFSRCPGVFTAFVFLLVGLVALTCALEEKAIKKYEERYAVCETRCQIFSKEECPSRVEKCQYLVRAKVYDDCIDEDEKCVNEGKSDCYKNFLKCLEQYAKD